MHIIGKPAPLQAENSPRSLIEIKPALIAKYDRPGPRYTSYPTADRFAEGYGPEQHLRTLQNRGLTSPDRPLSLYVHLPFCNTICYYCGCNKVVTKDHSRSATYLGYVEREVASNAVLAANVGLKAE